MENVEYAQHFLFFFWSKGLKDTCQIGATCIEDILNQLRPGRLHTDPYDTPIRFVALANHKSSPFQSIHQVCGAAVSQTQADTHFPYRQIAFFVENQKGIELRRCDPILLQQSTSATPNKRRYLTQPLFDLDDVLW